MYTSQHIIEVKSHPVSGSGTYHCVIRNDDGTSKMTDAEFVSAEKNRRIIDGKEESDSNEHPTEKHVSASNLVMTTKTPHNTFSHRYDARGQTNRPIFLEKPKSLTAEEGQCVKFTSRLKGHPMPSVHWEKDGRQIIGERVKITSNNDTFSLEIPNSTLNDAGRYVCIAINDSGEARCMVSLMVQKCSGQAAKFLPTKIRPAVPSGSSGAQIHTFSLHPMNQSCFDSHSLPKNCKEVRSKPSVVFQQVEYLAVDGEKICMSCNISGSPEPKVSWFQEMILIEPSETVKISYQHGISSLELLSVTATEGGTYMCQAENDLGISFARCRLSIQNNSSLQQQVEKSVVESDLNVTKGSSVSSQREITPKDDVQVIPVELMSGDAGLHPLQLMNSSDSSLAISQNEGCHYSEKVSISTPSSQLDSRSSVDTNTCLKETELKEHSLGKTSDNEKNCDYDGDDDDAFERPSNEMNSCLSYEPPLIEDLQPVNVNVLIGSEFQLIATFCGKPTPDVQWYKGSELLIQDDRIRFEAKPQCVKLIVAKAQPQDTGIYALVLVNEFGQDKQLSSVTVEDKPEPPVGPPAMTSILDNSLVLSWSGSSYDGGCPVLKYKVEISRNDTDIWECLTDDCQHTTYQVHNLVPNTQYMFRISAANKHGFSIPGCSTDPIITNRVKKSIPYEDFPFLPHFVALEKDRKFADFYTLGEVIGKGKFGSVYKCSEKSTGRLFAAKSIRTKSNQSSEFRQEIEIMNALHHPKLLLLWDAFESSREITLVMEHVSGGELMERIINDDYVLTERECIHFMRQICEGVQYMHSCSILHLDLKPENILCVTANSNEIKIIDFGLARKFDPQKEFRIMFGTAEFVAPEVINYDTIGYTTDMWSIGVICYILLSGLSPFLGDKDSETFVNVTKAQFDFDDEAFDDITEDAKDFISKLLVKDPRKRLQSEESLKHQWLAQDVTYMRAKKLSTDKHKKFMARNKWQKTGHALMALRRMVGLQRTSTGTFESCRSTSSLSSQTDSHSVVSDSNEMMLESDDSGYDNCPTQSFDSKSSPVLSKDLETVAEYETTEDNTKMEQNLDSDFNFKTS